MGSLSQQSHHRTAFYAAVVASCLLFLSALTLSSLVFPSQVYAAEAEPPLYGMIVSGKRPGPPLWKVTNEDKVLWIFGTLQYLPKGLKWDPSSVRYILGESDEYISPPQVKAWEANPFKAYGVMRRLNRLQKNPGGESLQAVLPAELYARFLAAKSIYAPDDNDILNLRPAAASNELFSAARKASGLAFDQKVPKKLRSLARGRGTSLTSHNESIDIDAFLSGYEKIQLQDEIACLETTLETIRTDLNATVERANAWAEGDARLLLNLDYPDTEKFCGIALFKSAEVKTVVEQSRKDWVMAVESALTTNKVSFASFPMREIAHPEGLLTHLRQQGYVVTGQSVVDSSQ